MIYFYVSKPINQVILKRRNFLNFSFSALLGSLFFSKKAAAETPNKKTIDDQSLKKENQEGLVSLNIPSPKELRGGWAALAAVCASRGWGNDVYAKKDQWFYHDGGGNWVCLRFKEKNKAILIGHDHEYTETYYGEAAKYFEEEETDILADTPDWWSFDMNPAPFGEWIGFVYGWDGEKWQRANYDKPDGFKEVNLIDACSMNDFEQLQQHSFDAPGNNGKAPSDKKLKKLVDADANITPELLENIVPGWDIKAGVEAAKKFLEADI